MRWSRRTRHSGRVHPPDERSPAPPARLADVAAAAGVSPALVSRVLNGDERVRAAAGTKRRIIDAAARLGYVPNVAARGLRASRTGLVGLVVHDLSSPIYLELMHGARVEAAARGCFLVLGDIDELVRDEAAYTILVSGRRVDGLIVQGGHGEFDRRIADIARSVPTVVVNAPASADERPVAHVVLDEAGATRRLVEHLLTLGHTRIGLVSGPRDSTTNRLREEGMRGALDDAGLALLDDDLVHGDWSAEAGRAGLAALVRRWRGGEDRPTALIAGNAMIAIGILGAAHEHGLQIPQDLSVAGVHDPWIAEHVVPSLTTVRLPLREMGEIAVRRLLDDPGSVATTTVEEPAPLLFARSSTAPPQAR
ncbi:LacI family DNA-binding transcriptional regulator [Agrococcus sp. 1P02AA]|uniref:LacI family DNA-binding transcriptional regulator n=1 Tax=Agrococcus sp. 1P02AA TaxID=3132259 RepID=UPI0039A5C39F